MHDQLPTAAQRPASSQPGFVKEPETHVAPGPAVQQSSPERDEGGISSPRGAPPMPPESSDEANQQLTAHLRELRAEVLDLQRVLERITKGVTTPKAQANYLKRTRKDLKTVTEEIDCWFNKLPVNQQARDADTFRHIKDSWEQICTNPILLSPNQDMDAQRQLYELNILNDEIDRIVFYIAMKTLPSRIKDWLHDAKAGNYVPFYEVFDDDLPKQEGDRKRILDALSWSSPGNNGYYIDSNTGLIYRVDTNAEDRKRSLQKLVMWFVGATIVLLLFPGVAAASWRIFTIKNGDNPGVLPVWSTAGILLTLWLALCAGVVAHEFIKRVKLTQNQPTRPPLVTAGGLSLLANAKYGELLFKIGTALFGSIGYMLSVQPNTANIGTAFLLGYSLNSVVDVFSAAVEKESAARVTALQTRLKK